MVCLIFFLFGFSLRPYSLIPETRVYDLLLKGAVVGTYYIDIDTAVYEGKKAYRISYWTSVGEKTSERSHFFVSRETFRPLYSRKVITGEDENSVIQAFYLKDSVRLKLTSPSGDREMSFPLNDSTFDNSSLYMVLSALDFEGKPSGNLRVVQLIQGTLLNASYRVGEREDVDLGGQRYTVYPVTLRFLNKNIEVLYEAGMPHRLVRYLELDTGSGFILREVKKK